MKIGVFDSGIGGISVLRRLYKEFDGAEFVYYGDNFNAPYGNRTERDVVDLSVQCATRLLEYDVDAIVVACNTASALSGKVLRNILGVPVFVIRPPIEREIISGKTTLLLCTVATARSFWQYGSFNNLKIYAVNGLVEAIEKDPFGANRIDVSLYLNGIDNDYETVILGCTHYFFVKVGICDHLQPKRIVSGEDDLVYAMKKFPIFAKNTKKPEKNRVLFIGDSKTLNEKIFISGQVDVYRQKKSLLLRKNF